MHKLNFLFRLLCIVFVFASVSFAQDTKPAFAPDELLVKFKDRTSKKAVDELNRKAGAETDEVFEDLGWQKVKLPKDLSIDEALAFYEKMPEVESVQPNYYYSLQSTPNDSQFGSLWGMQKISAPAAWDLTTGSQTVVVANIDTGMRYLHEDLNANMWTNPGEINGNNIDDDGNGFVDDYFGYDFFFNDPDPMDENGHGTHTGGTIGAVGNNSVGVAGINWKVRIMAIKIYNSTGFGTTSAMLINAYNYIRMMKNRGVNIRVTNNSYGGCDEACGYDQATKDAIDALGNAGILNVFAAGNSGRNIEGNPFYPASYDSPSIVSVANSTEIDERNTSSNYGNVSVDLAAPGTNILSTVLNSANYGNLSGTSMATPHVAGAVALLASYNPNLSAASLKASILNSVDPLPLWTTLVKTGGRLNVDRALRSPTVCAFNLSANSLNVPTKGGIFNVPVTTSTNCDYAAKSNSSWISVLRGSSLSGNGTVSLRVSTNSAITRTGTVTIGGQTFTVRQSRVPGN